ncbi:MAG TPA: PIN domain-containing protein [Thermoanaerobaculia bacterium]|nr:PIN domain-containing protein [Thermoanaerobaculia bacterium]
MEFVDTNVLLYSISRAPEEREKAAVARAILRRRTLALSVQVLQEFYVQATRESRADRLRHYQAVRLVEAWCRYPVQELTLSILRAAFVTRSRWRLSYWDGAILEAARASGCAVVLSEDLADGEDYDGVRVENPFRDVG